MMTTLTSTVAKEAASITDVFLFPTIQQDNATCITAHCLNAVLEKIDLLLELGPSYISCRVTISLFNCVEI